MASVWIVTRQTGSGARRYRVEYRVSGRESAITYGGSFRTKREAQARKQWLAGELAARRVPDLGVLGRERERVRTVATVAQAWQESRVDVSAGTAQTYRVALGRLLPRLGAVPVEEVDAQTVAALVAELHAAGLRKQTIRKTVSVLAMVLDHAGVSPNPARDRVTVRMPREERRHVQPPTADHVEAVVRLLPARYRLPALVLDATGMRIGELEALTWGDMDEPRGRWRIATSKTGRPRWVTPPPVLLERVLALCPRDDRHPDRCVFEGVTSERLRTAIARACTAAGVPAFSPHDLRHRRVSLMHLGGIPWARIGEAVGHDDLVTTARTYTHVVADEREIDYATVLG
ncbi:MAG: tyrosine-type recombinase/integrase [Thermoleophilia bacterium]|nr:tyrosine-type recombinase/integrase [Thermoleophilia bacterium]